MSQEYWNKKHVKDYQGADWVNKPSIFATQAIEFFPKNGKILEIGTGQGNDAKYFHELGYKVIATDFSPVAIEDAKKRVPDVEFLEADTSQGLPFADEYFDAVYSHMALHYFDQETTTKIFHDIHRILKPGGILAAITNTTHDPEKATTGYTQLEDEFYVETGGIKKRYFSEGGMAKFIEGLFETFLLDSQGKTYKDTDIHKLIRFVGKKI